MSRSVFGRKGLPPDVVELAVAREAAWRARFNARPVKNARRALFGGNASLPGEDHSRFWYLGEPGTAVPCMTTHPYYLRGDAIGAMAEVARLRGLYIEISAEDDFYFPGRTLLVMVTRKMDPVSRRGG